MAAGAPKGNQNALKGTRWRQALEKALGNFQNDGVKAGDALYHIAMKAIEQALQGDKDARAEIANRLDGKPTEYKESVVHKTHTYRAVLETDSRIAELLGDGQVGDTTPTLPH